MLAIGYTTKGEIKKFECSDGYLCCRSNDLVSLQISEGVKYVYCRNNLLSELIIPEGVKYVYCINNKLTELKLPESVIWLRCDKEIKGLDKLIGNIDIKLW